MNAKVTKAADDNPRGDSIEWAPTIAPEKVCDLILRVREFQAKEAGDDLVEGSNPADDGMTVVLQDDPSDSVELELSEFIRGLNTDEQIDLVALAWLGRGDGSRDDWSTLREDAAREHGARTMTRYLIGMPLLADYLDAALAEFGQACGD